MKNLPPLILVSQSPRRAEILSRLGQAYRVEKVDFEERLHPKLRPAQQTAYLAEGKLREYLRLHPDCDQLALSADTLLGFRGQPIGKPGSLTEARQTLHRLSGRTHSVYTSLSLYSPHDQKILTRTACSKVTFHRLSEPEIDFYLASDDWRDAAGGYKIQSNADFLIKRLNGSFSNVVGLPIRLFYEMILSIIPSLGR